MRGHGKTGVGEWISTLAALVRRSPVSPTEMLRDGFWNLISLIGFDSFFSEACFHAFSQTHRFTDSVGGCSGRRGHFTMVVEGGAAAYRGVLGGNEVGKRILPKTWFRWTGRGFFVIGAINVLLSYVSFFYLFIYFLSEW